MTINTARHDVVSDHARREFLRQSLHLPVAVSALAGTAAWLSGCAREPAAAVGYRVLRADDILMLEKLLPAAIGDGMPPQAPERLAAVRKATRAFDQLLYDTSPAIRGAFLPLLDLLTAGITRGPLFGAWKSWENTDEAAALAVLDDWASSRSGFMRAAYNAFVSLAAMSWYLAPEHQSVTGYPGPPRKAAVALS